MLGAAIPTEPITLDTNVFINALAWRVPPVLRDLLEEVPSLFVAAPVRAELAWVRGCLDPDHAGRVLFYNRVADASPARSR